MIEQGGPRYLIVNADDFGMSTGVNRGIIDSHRHGIVTSASLMVRWPAAEEAAALSREFPQLSVGLHVDLGEWAVQDDEWFPLYDVVDCDDPVAVRRELETQLNAFRKLLSHNPTHLDSHQHVHRNEPLRSVLLEMACELSIPVRHFSDEVRYCGDFYGQTAKGDPLNESISAAALIDVINALEPGITELGCHPGLDDNLNTMYRRERRQEVATLCDDRVRQAIEAGRLHLRSFAHLPKATAGRAAPAAEEGVLACEN